MVQKRFNIENNYQYQTKKITRQKLYIPIKNRKFTNMDTLQKEIKTNGHIYHQIDRTNNTAIYSQHNKDGQLAGYEVFIIRIAPEQEVMGKQYPERELFPKNEDFGKTAWSVGIDQTHALKRFKEISNFAKGKTIRAR